jgi:hypothetical protein
LIFVFIIFEQYEKNKKQKDLMELTGSRGTANFIKKWEGEQSQSYLKVSEGCVTDRMIKNYNNTSHM